MNILITGGNGFIAGHLKNFLSQHHTVFAPGKDQLNCLDTGAVNSFFETHTIDIVIHTALSGREKLFDSDTKWMHDGLSMWTNIYANKHKFKKLIQFGSGYELDLSVDNQLSTLDDVLNSFPITPYGISKNQIARMCNRTEHFYTLRLFGHFHFTESDNRFFKKLSLSNEFTINEDQIFDYFNLEDTLTVVEFVINETPDTRDINLVYNQKLLMSEQAEIFCRINQINPCVTIKSTGNELTGDPAILNSFNLKLQGLEAGFKKYQLSKTHRS